jgi:hypothetical protein
MICGGFEFAGQLFLMVLGWSGERSYRLLRTVRNDSDRFESVLYEDRASASSYYIIYNRDCVLSRKSIPETSFCLREAEIWLPEPGHRSGTPIRSGGTLPKKGPLFREPSTRKPLSGTQNANPFPNALQCRNWTRPAEQRWALHALGPRRSLGGRCRRLGAHVLDLGHRNAARGGSNGGRPPRVFKRPIVSLSNTYWPLQSHDFIAANSRHMIEFERVWIWACMSSPAPPVVSVGLLLRRARERGNDHQRQVLNESVA